MLLLVSACAHRSDPTPGATIQPQPVVELRFEDTAPPRAFVRGDDEAYFVAWARERGEEGYGRLGVLQWDEASANASLTTTTPLDDFEVMVTVERAPGPEAPTTPVLLRADCDVDAQPMPTTIGRQARTVSAPPIGTLRVVRCEVLHVAGADAETGA